MWISKIDFEALTGKASAHDKIVASILKFNEGMKAEDVTPEFIQEAMEASENGGGNEQLTARVTELESEVEQLTSTNTSVTKERDDLKSENDDLRELPGAESVSKEKAKVENSTVVVDSLVEFANKNKGDFAAIAAEMAKEGLV